MFLNMLIVLSLFTLGKQLYESCGLNSCLTMFKQLFWALLGFVEPGHQ
uniref:Uncharacterized protein n=1 Tax=Arundo donax TaxID=35708 RepID=A0A0A9U1I5_ARUDO